MDLKLSFSNMDNQDLTTTLSQLDTNKLAAINHLIALIGSAINIRNIYTEIGLTEKVLLWDTKVGYLQELLSKLRNFTA